MRPVVIGPVVVAPELKRPIVVAHAELGGGRGGEAEPGAATRRRRRLGEPGGGRLHVHVQRGHVAEVVDLGRRLSGERRHALDIEQLRRVELGRLEDGLGGAPCPAMDERAAVFLEAHEQRRVPVRVGGALHQYPARLVEHRAALADRG